MTVLALILVALTAVVGAIAGRLSAHGLLGAALAAVTALAAAGAALAALAAPPVHGVALAATYVTAVVAAATGGAPWCWLPSGSRGANPMPGPERTTAARSGAAG